MAYSLHSDRMVNATKVEYAFNAKDSKIYKIFQKEVLEMFVYKLKEKFQT